MPRPSGFGWGEVHVAGWPTQKVGRVPGEGQVVLSGGSWTQAATGEGPALHPRTACRSASHDGGDTMTYVPPAVHCTEVTSARHVRYPAKGFRQPTWTRARLPQALWHCDSREAAVGPHVASCWQIRSHSETSVSGEGELLLLPPLEQPALATSTTATASGAATHFR